LYIANNPNNNPINFLGDVLGKYHVILCLEYLLNTLKEIQEEKREKERQRDTERQT